MTADIRDSLICCLYVFGPIVFMGLLGEFLFHCAPAYAEGVLKGIGFVCFGFAVALLVGKARS